MTMDLICWLKAVLWSKPWNIFFDKNDLGKEGKCELAVQTSQEKGYIYLKLKITK